MKLEDILDKDNIVDDLDQETLDKLSTELTNGLKADESSRAGWVERTEEYIRLATQVVEEKNFPWPNASNVKYPMLTTAALQFSARAYPALVSGDNPVSVQTIGFDPTGQKQERAVRMSKHMSYQLLHKMEEWEENMDRTLITLPIVGTAFKKTYFDPNLGRNVSELVNPLDFVINYYAKSVDGANRKFHRFTYYENEVVERMRSGFYAEVDLEKEDTTQKGSNMDEETQDLTQAAGDDDAPYDILECHSWHDLDEDGYKEPYIVTMIENTGTILRIVPRFQKEAIEFNDKGDVQKITSDEYFTGYIFIPDPVSTVYGLGFGHLLGPLNETANTLINQLIDAGTLQNAGGGFLGRGFKLRNMGNIRFKPGEWKTTQSTGDDLRKSIFPLPVNQPSPTLFNLLGTVIDSGQRLSATMDIMMGESPGQNQPATTTMAVLEQGLKVFTSIHKRVYRSFRKELKKLFKLNAKYLQPVEYFRVLDISQGQPPQQQGMPQAPGQPPMQMQPGIAPDGSTAVTLADYQDSLTDVDVLPSSDPRVVSQAQSLMKAEALLQLAGTGAPLNMGEVLRRVLEAQEQPNVDVLLNAPPPPPDPMLEMEKEKWEHQKQYDNRKLDLEAQRVMSEAVKDESQGIKSRVDARATLRKLSNEELATEAKAVDARVALLTQPDQEKVQMEMKSNESSGMGGE